MKPAIRFFATIALTIAAGLTAWGAWQNSRPLLGEILPGGLRAFVFEFRFVVSLVAVLVVLGIGEWLVAAIERRLGGGD
jgi:hypothetical protein